MAPGSAGGMGRDVPPWRPMPDAAHPSTSRSSRAFGAHVATLVAAVAGLGWAVGEGSALGAVGVGALLVGSGVLALYARRAALVPRSAQAMLDDPRRAPERRDIERANAAMVGVLLVLLGLVVAAVGLLLHHRG